MAKIKYDKQRVGAVLSALRDGTGLADDDQPILAWLEGGGDLDALDPVAGVTAVQAALEAGLSERIAAAGAARDKDVRKLARAAAHKLRSQGVEVPQAKAAASWSIGREDRAELPPRALVGLPEDDGYVPFLLSSVGHESACVSGGAAGPARGFRDDDHGHVSRSQARKILDEAQGDHRLFEVPFYEAVAVLEQAFDAGGGQRPGGFGHLLSHVDADALQAARDGDPLGGLAASLDEDALHRPGPLLEGAWVVPYAADSDALAPFLERALGVLADAGQDEAGMRAAIHELVDDATDAVLGDAARSTWAYGLTVHAWLAARAGEDDVSQVSRATALALADADRAGRDVPWAREWVNRHLSYVVDMAVQYGRQGQLPSAD
ncbi:MAG: hypothetical protein H6742_10865 [Alphaproteobacteria bacterium]|nr:hypothetical protein [Alphaproteobacteria bacterium]